MSDTFEFDDQNHAERFVGTLHDPKATVGDVLTVQADKSIAAAPGGGSGGVQTHYDGNNVSIGDGSNAQLTWDTLLDGTDLLDRSTPDTPTFLAAGTYAISATVTGDVLTAAGYAVATLLAAGITTNAAYTQSPGDGFGPAGVIVAAAGDTLVLLVENFDGVSARDYIISTATIVKLA